MHLKKYYISGSDPIMERPSLTVTSSCGPTKKIHYPFLQGEGISKENLRFTKKSINFRF